jgi:hypothetical protein
VIVQPDMCGLLNHHTDSKTRAKKHRRITAPFAHSLEAELQLEQISADTMHLLDHTPHKCRASRRDKCPPRWPPSPVPSDEKIEQPPKLPRRAWGHPRKTSLRDNESRGPDAQAGAWGSSLAGLPVGRSSAGPPANRFPAPPPLMVCRSRGRVR